MQMSKRRVQIGILILIFAVCNLQYAVPAPGPVEYRPFLPGLVPPATCAESAHSFDVRCYQIGLKLPMTSGACTAQVRVTITSRAPALESLSLMMDSLVCDSVKRNGTALAFTRPTGLLTIMLDAPLGSGESTAIDIFYHRRTGIPNRGFFYFPRGSRSAQCYSVAAPYDARFWFPCFDEPFDKAEQGCAISVTVPESLSVCANGLLDSVRRDSAAHTRTFSWCHRYPISTYLIVFAASNWFEYVQCYNRGLPDSVVVRSFVWVQDTTYVQYNLRNITDMLAFYCDTNRFGPYPFERYGHVYVTGFQYGGMENQTLTMLALYQVNEATVSHELSHMWWGDMVTCIDYRNIWLNEGFAEYWDAQYTEHQSGHDAFLSLMDSRARSYFSEDAHNRFATYNPPLSQVYAFGTIYCKGSWIQHMLRYLENDTVLAQTGVFYRALRAYGDSFRYRGASTQDYQRIHERSTGLDLSWFVDEWLYQAGYPQYRLAWSVESVGPDFRVTTNLSQDNGSNAPAVFHMPVQIRFRRISGDTLDTLIVLPVRTSPQIDTFRLGFRPATVSFDPGKWLLGKVAVLAIAEADIPHPAPELEISSPGLARGTIQFHCHAPATAELRIYDAAGREVRTFALNRGEARIAFDAGMLPAGIYVARLATRHQAVSRKITIVRL